jgi:carbon monoxide dehydrogenase subunit G
MNIQGEHWLPATPEVVWETIHDEAILKATIPGCQELRQTSPTSFSGAANVGIGVIKGLYRGTLQLEEEQPFTAAKIRIDTRSGHAEIHGTGSVELKPSDGGTLVKYEGDARISGMLAVVGQRLLPSASKSLTEQFLKNVEDVLAKQSSEAQ